MDTTILNADAIQINNIDLKKITKEEVNQIAKLYFKHLVVVIKNQTLTAQELHNIAKLFGNIEYFDKKTVNERSPDNVNGVQRVCAGVNEDGSPMGLFGHNSDLDWHCNRPSAENERKPIVFLYAVNASTGSRISWLNNSLSYNDLSITNKKWLENKKGIYGFKPNTYTKNFNVWKPHKNTVGQKFIRENAVGQKGMFFPIHQFFGFKDVDENISKDMTQLLYQHAYQEKYMYHHDYEDGDIIFGDQWLTVHKRWACELGNRMLYRITMDWMNIQI